MKKTEKLIPQPPANGHMTHHSIIINTEEISFDFGIQEGNLLLAQLLELVVGGTVHGCFFSCIMTHVIIL